jgi:16S rRNA (guanine527-N7)-methyltransferase
VPELAFGPAEFAARTGVSRETLARLKAYADILADWNARHNLVAKSTLPDLWRRHFWDSAQLAPLIPDTARTLADLGSGAGFPGLVLTVMLPRLAVTLHEATAKKCAFLRAAAERMGVPVTIQNARLEDLPPHPFDVVTARALAPLPKLLGYAQNFVGPNSVCLFSKGQNVGVE